MLQTVSNLVKMLINYRKATCQKKVPHETEKLASKERKFQIRKHGDSARLLKVIYCKVCGCYHLGRQIQGIRYASKKQVTDIQEQQISDKENQ